MTKKPLANAVTIIFLVAGSIAAPLSAGGTKGSDIFEVNRRLVCGLLVAVAVGS